MPAEFRDTSNILEFYVNGIKVTEPNPDPEVTLLTYLRTRLNLTGTKLGCGEGGCGACTVMVSRYLPQVGTTRHYSVNACLAPLCSMQGLAVTTVEGIGSLKNIHPVQERIAKFHGSQCGFCTPGFVMSMYTLLRNNHLPSDSEVEDSLAGNLCRCTGYRPILDGFRTFTKEFNCAMGSSCCRNSPVSTDRVSPDNNNNNNNNNSNNNNSLSAARDDLVSSDTNISSHQHDKLSQTGCSQSSSVVRNGPTDADSSSPSDGLSSRLQPACCQDKKSTCGSVGGCRCKKVSEVVAIKASRGETNDKKIELQVNGFIDFVPDEKKESSSNFDERIKSLEVLGPQIATLKPYDPSQEPIFPPDLKINYKNYHGTSKTFIGPRVTWLQPVTVNELIELKAKYPSAKIVVGNTEIGVETKLKFMHYPVLISTTNIPELQFVSANSTGVTVGAAVMLEQLDQEFRKLIDSLPGYQTKILSAVVEILKWFAGHQIRNVASLAGNLMTASPISDLNPILLAAGATLLVQSQARGQRTLQIDPKFFCGYRKTAVESDEVLLSVTIPFTQENEYFAAYKQANRKEDDIAIVNAGMLVALSNANTITKFNLAFGGMGVTVLVASSTAEQVLGDKWNDELMTKLTDLLASDLPLPPGVPGGFAEYRQALALSFVFKFFTTVKLQIQTTQKWPDLSAIDPMESPPHKTMQVIGGVDARLRTHDVVGKPLAHLSALQQSTGEAIYIDDMPPITGELHLALVTSTHPHAKILSIDPSAALSLPGVVAFVSAVDVPGVNSLGIFMDTVFAVDQVTCQGYIIGAVVADTQVLARNASKLVNVQYEPKQPVIITIEDAIQHGSFYKPERRIQVGDLEAGFSGSSHILQGEVRVGGQNHFYMETMATRVVPLENGEMEIFSSTQNPSSIQMDVAKVLGIPSSKIAVRVKRVGGGFGGKEGQTLFSAAPAAVAAKKLGRPVRCVLDRDVDMITTGNRNPFLAKYKVGFTNEGKIMAIDLELYNNAGNSLDLSMAVMEKAITDFDGPSYIPNLRIVGRACRTNIMSNTAFRGFGAPQTNFIRASIFDEVASLLDLPSKQVEETNLYPPEARTFYDMPAGGESIRRCWSMCLERSYYQIRQEQIDQYNREHQWKKKGIALCAVKFGISFLQKHMNQAGALVHIYRDGSVLVAHSGIEMGQGLNIKVAQIASEVLEVPLSLVHISETSTATVPNTSPTAASVGTDINGMAVKNACETLKERLQPYYLKMSNARWEEVISAAYFNRTSLSAAGFYATPEVGFNMDTRTGKPYAYFTCGAACTEVQIDCLTGDHKLLRTDIVMDVGNSVNPAIDIGQIEGAFAQGCGLHLLEDLKVTPDGSHLTRGPGNYKIPACGNIPAEFNVYLLPDSPNPNAVFASRAVGEPPLLLAASAFFAVKDAIRAARKAAGASTQFNLNSPALPSDIRMACQDIFAKKFPRIDPATYKPWSVML